MQTFTIEEIQAQLPELLDNLQPGEEITITREQKPVARLVCDVKRDRPPRKLGTLKGTVIYMAPDFDAPLDEFREYMP